jgi:hypothetical protein
MHPMLLGAVTGGLACAACGRLPHPHRVRLTLVKLLAVFPVELLLHALVVHYHLSYAATVALLSVSTTVLVLWVVEPSAMRALRTWLHAPQLRAEERLGAATALWRVRATVDDSPGALRGVTEQLAALDANILSLHVHPLDEGARDELVVATGEAVRGEDLVAAAEAGGGRDAHAWRTTALALVDGPTKALALAARVAEDPSELPLAAAELLGARVVTSRLGAPDPRRAPHGPGHRTLHVPTPWTACIVLERSDEPFTPAESARAARLAQIAEVAALRQVERPSRTADSQARASRKSSSPVPARTSAGCPSARG